MQRLQKPQTQQSQGIRNIANTTSLPQIKVLDKQGQLNHTFDDTKMQKKPPRPQQNQLQQQQNQKQLTDLILNYDNEQQQQQQQQQQQFQTYQNKDLQNYMSNQQTPSKISSYSNVRGTSSLSRQKQQRNRPTQMSVFPMYGLWSGKTTFQSTKQLSDSYVANERSAYLTTSGGNEELKIDRSNFRKMYFEKSYMEELLKMKNMMGKVKK